MSKLRRPPGASKRRGGNVSRGAAQGQGQGRGNSASATGVAAAAAAVGKQASGDNNAAAHGFAAAGGGGGGGSSASGGRPPVQEEEQSSFGTELMMFCRRRQGSGADGGTASADTEHNLTLTETLFNTIPGASMAASIITLPAGTYYAELQGNTYDVRSTKVFLYNITAAEYTLTGLSHYADDAAETCISMCYGEFTIAIESTFRMITYTKLSNTGDGLGRDSANDGTEEVHASIMIKQITGESLPFMHCQDVKAVLTDGGAATAGEHIRTLNTVLTNTIPGASLADGILLEDGTGNLLLEDTGEVLLDDSNAITLPAGTYWIEWDVTASKGAQWQSWLHDIGVGSIIEACLGTNAKSTQQDNRGCHSWGAGQLITAGTSIHIVHSNQTTNAATRALGFPADAGTHNEIYSDIRIWKEA